MERKFLSLLCVLLIMACNQVDQTADDTLMPLYGTPRKVPLNITQGYTINQGTGQPCHQIINANGDTVKTGISTTVTGRLMNAMEVSTKKRLITSSVISSFNQGQVCSYSLVAEKQIKELDLYTYEPTRDSVKFLLGPYGDTIPLGVPVPIVEETFTANHPKAISAAPPRKTDIAKLDIQYLNEEQGILSSEVISVLQDSRGYMWFGTNQGACRYDGSKFMHFNSKNGIHIFQVFSMEEDSKGNMWFATDGGIVRYNGKTYTPFTAEQGVLYDNLITYVLEDNSGDLWFGTNDGVILRYQPGTARDTTAYITHFKVQDTPDAGIVFCIYEDNDGNKWFGFDRGVCKYDGNKFIHIRPEEGLPQGKVMDLLESRDGKIWIGSGDGICIYETSADRAEGILKVYKDINEVSQDAVRSIVEDVHGNLWLGLLNNGVIKFNYADNTDQILSQGIRLTQSDGLPDNYVWDLYGDTSGMVWMGTQGGGANWINPNSFSYLSFPENVQMAAILAIYEDSEHNIWFGTEGKGLYKIELSDANATANIRLYEEVEGMDLQSVRGLCQDQTGNLWCSTYSGLFRIANPNEKDEQTVSFYSLSQSHRPAFLMDIEEDRHGNIWIGTYGNGVICLAREQDGSFRYFNFTMKEGLSDDYVLEIREDRQGRIWFLTETGGACCYHPTETVEKGRLVIFSEREGLIKNHLTCMYEDQDGNIWFGTEGFGVCRLRLTPDGQQGEFTYITETEGLSSNIIRSILGAASTGKDEQIWVSTWKGLNTILIGSPNSIQTTSFLKPDGLMRTDFSFSSSGVDHQKNLWWGSTKGMEIINKGQIDISKNIPNPIIQQVDINEEFVDYRMLPDTLKKGLQYDSVVNFENIPLSMSLPHKMNHLTFYFSAMDWLAPHKIQYSYFMEGLDNKWSNPSNEGKADYRNLPAGSFTLKVRAIGESQIWSEPVEYSFTIRPPWYLSWWAYLGYILLGGTVANRMHRYRLDRKLELAEKRRLQELDEYKNKLYSNITHEFRSPLTLIHGPVTNALNSGKTLEAKEIASIHRQSMRLQQLINQMLDLQKIEAGKMKVHYKHGDIVQHVSSVSTMFDSWAHEKKIKLSFNADPEEMYMDFDEDKLTQIVSNLLSNAIKHTPENGKVAISLQHLPTTNTFQIAVQDNGIGISSEDLPFIFERYYQSSRAAAGGTGIGMALTKNLVDLLKGSITVESLLDVGTTFKVSLPVTKHATYVPPDVSRVYDPIRMESFYEEPAIVPTDEKANKPIVLVVEDHHEVMQYIASCLAGEYNIITAADGVEGLRKAFEHIPDLVVSDVMMPRKDGFELCATLKTDIQTSHIPVILLTGRSDHPALMSGIEHGADAYVVKPFDPAELQLRVKKLLELRTNLVEHYRQHAVTRDVENHVQASPRENEFLKNIRAFIEEHMSDAQFNMDMLCQHMAMSHPQLHRKMTALTGDSTGKFVRSVRLTKAKELLMRSDLTISEIAYETGFSDPGYFAKVFSKEYDMSPSEFRGKGG